MNGLNILIVFCMMNLQNPNIEGKWQSTDRDKQLHLKIRADTNGTYSGETIDDPDVRRNGLLVLKYVRYDSASGTYQGYMTPANENISMTATLKMEGADKIKVTVKKFLIVRTLYLERIK